MTEPTTDVVENRLQSAADVFRQLPDVKPQRYFNQGNRVKNGLATA